MRKTLFLITILTTTFYFTLIAQTQSISGKFTPPENGFIAQTPFIYQFRNCFGEAHLLISHESEKTSISYYKYDGELYNPNEFKTKIRPTSVFWGETDLEVDLYSGRQYLGELKLGNVIDFNIGGCIGQSYELIDVINKKISNERFLKLISEKALSLKNLKIVSASTHDGDIHGEIRERKREEERKVKEEEEQRAKEEAEREAEEQRAMEKEEEERKAKEERERRREEKEQREKNEYDSLIERADELYEDEDYSAAIDKYNEAVEYNNSKGNKYGSNSYATNRKNDALEEKQDNERVAKDKYEEALNISVLADIGNDDYDGQIKKYEEAIEDLREARRLNPDEREKIDRLIKSLQGQKSGKENFKREVELMEQQQALAKDILLEVQERQRKKWAEKEREAERKRKMADERYERRKLEVPTEYKKALRLGTKSAYQNYLDKYANYNDKYRDDIKSKIFSILNEEGKANEALSKMEKYQKYIDSSQKRISRKSNFNDALGWTIVGLSLPLGLVISDILIDEGIDGNILGLEVGESNHEAIAIGSVGSVLTILAIMGINELGIKTINKKSNKYKKSIRSMDFSINTKIGRSNLGAGIVITF